MPRPGVERFDDEQVAGEIVRDGPARDVVPFCRLLVVDYPDEGEDRARGRAAGLPADEVQELALGGFRGRGEDVVDHIVVERVAVLNALGQFPADPLLALSLRGLLGLACGHAVCILDVAAGVIPFLAKVFLQARASRDRCIAFCVQRDFVRQFLVDMALVLLVRVVNVREQERAGDGKVEDGRPFLILVGIVEGLVGVYETRRERFGRE